jgi:rod shape determining protein RodA
MFARRRHVRLKARVRQKVTLLRALPWGVVAPALLLACAGVAFIYSAGTDFGRVAEGLARPRDFYLRQAAFLAAALLVMLAVALMPPRWLMGRWPLWAAGGLCLLLAVFVLGRDINGARRWIQLGPFNLQPSELCKPLLIIALAGYLRYHPRVDSLKALACCAGISAAFLVPILMQPDGGTVLVLVPVVAAMLWVAGGNRLYLGILAALGAAVLPLAYLSGALKDYQMRRIDTYLSGLAGDIADRGGDGYHIVQSMAAIGSGGLTGKGFGAGAQSQLAYLPERHTDFIFAVVAEETGLLGVAVFFVLLCWLVMRMLDVAQVTREPFSRLVVIGCAAMLFVQSALNVAVVCGVAPLTGLTLPLLSYGGSSLLSAFVLIGLVCNIAIQPARVIGRPTF